MSRMGVTTCDTVQDELNRLHDTYHLCWREIALIEPYKGIPPGTLSSIASGKKKIPHKWLHQLGLPETKPAPVCVHCGEVHVSSRCPHRPIARIVVHGKTYKAISKRRFDVSKPFGPVLVVVEAE